MRRSLLAVLALTLTAAGAPSAYAGTDRADLQETVAITQGNGDSSHPVISQDRRYSTVLAFESDASDLVGNDTNGLKDIFMVRRGGHIDNEGSPWQPGGTQLVTRGLGGAPANGKSWAAAIDGGFPEPGDDPTYPKCIAFLSDASNLVPGDTNGVTDAFISRGPGGRIERVSLPYGKQATKQRNLAVKLGGTASGAQFASGQTDDLVVAADAGVYLLKDGIKRPQL